MTLLSIFSDLDQLAIFNLRSSFGKPSASPPAVAALVDIELSSSALAVPGDDRPWLHVKATIINKGTRGTIVVPLEGGLTVHAVSGTGGTVTSRLIAVAPSEGFAHGCVLQPNAKCYPEFTLPVPKPGLYRLGLRLTLPEDEAATLRRDLGLAPNTIFLWEREVHVTTGAGSRKTKPTSRN